MVAEGKFREDLFYRLDVIPLRIPPLRERREDILPLADKFLTEFNRKNGFAKTLSPEVLSTFEQYHWPGNVRELRNMVERLVITSPGDVICADVTCPLSQLPIPTTHAVSGDIQIRPLKSVMHDMEKSYLEQALIQNGWNVRQTARLLEIHPSGLYKKIEEYGIKKS